MRYEITLDCSECEGFGYLTHQRSATLYVNSDCPECAGERYKVWIDDADNVVECYADYPDAVSIKPIAGAYHVQVPGIHLPEFGHGLFDNVYDFLF